MKISVITPSIRPDGLKVVFNALAQQTLNKDEWEWLPRLSIPGEKSDLCKQVNAALAEAKGELIVFLQDYITVKPDALERCWEIHRNSPKVCYTMPVGKDTEGDGFEKIDWDWRKYWNNDAITYERWEIDFGMCPAEAIKDVGFFEKYDDGFGWENVDTAFILSKIGYTFGVDRENAAVAYDHDKFIPHPYKKRPNIALWMSRKQILEELYGD